ncbi:hypothetical protein RJ639_009475 [Escallonia herrerae]|uniref:Synaptonemal complex protein 1 n=1 Tax=Escallonia herrerae TaxID=1293975 RepID=A0AA89ARA3_9ASTE|nr:hypothetical protein RJ639_009475 [Escallonia herrerae]
MNKLVGLSAMKSLEQFKSLAGSGFGSAKAYSMSSRPSSDSVSTGSFANLKLTAEKLVKEQASAKTDLDLANSKLKKLSEYIRVMEEKLQNAFNENAKLKVKQKEDEKLWKGLESKFSSTKTLCDQLTETLQHLAGQVQDAEKDKKFFEEKLSTTSMAIDNLHDQMKSLSLTLKSSEETVRNREEQLKQLGIEKEEKEKLYGDEQCRAAGLIEERATLLAQFFFHFMSYEAAKLKFILNSSLKYNMIKHFESSLAEKIFTVEGLNSKSEILHLELKVKEDDLKDLRNSKESLEKEKIDILSSNKKYSEELNMALEEIKKLEDFVNVLAAKLTEFDNQTLTFSEKVTQLNTMFDFCFKLAQEEKRLASQRAQQQFEQLHDQILNAASEKNALQLVNQDFNNKVIELQKEQEFAMVQHADECRLAEERIRRLEYEGETLHSKKTEMETLIIKLEETIGTLSDTSKSSEEKMHDLQLKLTNLEIKNKYDAEKLQADIQKKEEEIDKLQKEIGKHEKNADSMEKQVSQLHTVLEEKEQLIMQYKDRGKQLEDRQAEIQALLADAESNLAEAKKEYDQMLECKKLELSRHLKEISQRNDQAINDIRRKYEVDKLESVNLEKEKVGSLIIVHSAVYWLRIMRFSYLDLKANKVIDEMERNCDQKLVERREESKQELMRIQEEQTALMSQIQQEHEKEGSSLVSKHMEELKRVQLQAENELRERITSLRNEHEAQLRALRCQHEDERIKLQEELNVQKSKEERQRALLQLQWKVMGDKPQENQEVNSKKDYSISSTRMRHSDGGKSGQHLVRADDEEKESPYVKATQTPVSNLLKKVEQVNTGSIMSIPKHSRKVTRHEYEVETSNGRTITKKRRTKSTVMFEDPRKHKKRETPKANTPRTVAKKIKTWGHPNPSNIGDLFSEGSLNPYADDPYAFD